MASPATVATAARSTSTTFTIANIGTTRPANLKAAPKVRKRGRDARARYASTPSFTRIRSISSDSAPHRE